MSRYFKIFLIASCLYGCKSPVTPDDLEPDSSGGGKTISIQHLVASYLKSTPERISDDINIRGQIISSDWAGAFANSIIINDGSGSIEIRVDMDNYYKTYARGSMTTVKCAGLVIGTYGNSPQLGISYDYTNNECGKIPEYEINSYLLPSVEILDLDKPEIEINEIGSEMNNTLVVLTGVEFIDEHKGLAWCDKEPEYTYSERLLKSVAGFDTLTVRTHYKAHFADFPVPSGSGKIEGIVQYYYSKPSLQLISSFYHDMD